jgi:hypothetical protein
MRGVRARSSGRAARIGGDPVGPTESGRTRGVSIRPAGRARLRATRRPGRPQTRRPARTLARVKSRVRARPIPRVVRATRRRSRPGRPMARLRGRRTARRARARSRRPARATRRARTTARTAAMRRPGPRPVRTRSSRSRPARPGQRRARARSSRPAGTPRLARPKAKARRARQARRRRARARARARIQGARRIRHRTLRRPRRIQTLRARRAANRARPMLVKAARLPRARAPNAVRRQRVQIGQRGPMRSSTGHGSTPRVSGRIGPVVPGGGLIAHERAGGHLLARHVGVRDTQLAARLNADPRISAASSFPDRATAEAAVARALDSNQSAIRSWLGSRSNRLVLDQESPGPIGRVLLRGGTEAVESSNLRVVLQRDASFPHGYRIVTGFPTP